MSITPTTGEKPVLIGIALDVSASMLGAINNADASGETRLEGVITAIRQLTDNYKGVVGDKSAPGSVPVHLFAYGFGFGNPIARFLNPHASSVRDLLAAPGQAITTVPLDHVAAEWDVYQTFWKSLLVEMLGSTPMLEAMETVEERLEAELSTGTYSDQSIVLLISDGDPTDGSYEDVVAVARRLKAAGALVVSCLLVGHDLAEPRLYHEAGPNWPSGAAMMFACASPASDFPVLAEGLREYKWQIEPDAQLFAQLNQSRTLGELVSGLARVAEASSSLLPQLIPPSARGSVEAGRESSSKRVFISYSHRDRRYLSDDGLVGHLSSLERDGWTFFSDQTLKTGDVWDERIKSELESADIAIVLVSQAFLNSPYCQDVEISRFLERRKTEGLIIYPVILEPCDWKSHDWLAATVFMPRDGNTVAENYVSKARRARLFQSIVDELRGTTNAAS